MSKQRTSVIKEARIQWSGEQRCDGSTSAVTLFEVKHMFSALNRFYTISKEMMNLIHVLSKCEFQACKCPNLYMTEPRVAAVKQ